MARLQGMEAKIADTCINDTAMLLLNKELKKCTEMVNSISDSLESVFEEIIVT